MSATTASTTEQQEPIAKMLNEGTIHKIHYDLSTELMENFSGIPFKFRQKGKKSIINLYEPLNNEQLRIISTMADTLDFELELKRSGSGIKITFTESEKEEE